jgi:hypothetical protein
MMLSTKSFAVFAAILGLTLTFLVSSGVALGQEGNAGQSILGIPALLAPSIPTGSMMPR